MLALNKVSLQINKGEFVGIIGRTASGKSTLVQHFNALLRPTSGKIFIGGIQLDAKSVDLRWLRRRVGLVFQFPENQLFESTVIKDVEFGLKKLGFSKAEARAKAKAALEAMGLEPDKIGLRPPWSLSGGEKRRVAIACVLALEPEVLILDEPTAGLDPKGKNSLIAQLIEFHKSKDITVILVSHDLPLVMKICQRAILMRDGAVIADLAPPELLRGSELLEQAGLPQPELSELMRRLRLSGADVKQDVLNLQEARDEIVRCLSKGGKN
jgi:energy-coupling factor transport system ATP-binding protein